MRGGEKNTPQWEVAMPTGVKVEEVQEVGLFVSPLQTTQGPRQLSLGTSICLDVDPLFEVEPLTTTYLLLSSYSRW